MRKKLLSLALALALCLGLTVPAFAETRTKTIGDITITMDSDNTTLTYTGSGKLTEEHAEYGATYFIDLVGIVDTVTVNIGSGITADTQVLEVIKEVLFYYGVKYVNINGNSSAAVSQTVGGFTDVKKSDYFADPVVWAVNKEITSGTTETTFSPKKDCTVAEILMFLYKAKGAPQFTAGQPYTNVTGSEWYADAALWAYGEKLVSGGEFQAGTPCTRAMVVDYLWKLAGSPSAKETAFEDVPANADYAQAVKWAVEKGVTAGVSKTQFGPDVVCTRGQIVTFLYAALKK